VGQQRFDKPDDWEKIRQQWLFDDFFAYLDTFTWTKGVTGGGTAPTVIINATTAATQLWLGNVGSASGAEAFVKSTNAFWQWSASHPLHAIFRINAQEANTNNLSIFCGYSDSFATGLVTNANPNAFKTSSTSCGFFLPAGSTTWSVVLAVAGAPQTVATLEAAVPTGDQYLMVQSDIVGTGIEATFMVGTADTTGGADSTFPVGWQQARETLSGFNKPIKLRAAFSGAAAMAGGVYMRQTSTTPETVKVDFIGLLSLR
jgi:hypothetical protein